MEYLLPARQFSVETNAANSRFITTIGPAYTVDDARAFIKAVKERYSDANHNVPVYQIGYGPSLIAHSNDDGEPAGTAGRPALYVLQGSKLGDTVLVITRYFGGTKLGTGGLVKAYSNAARSAIKAVPKATKMQVSHCQMVFDYQHFDLIDRILRSNNASIMDREFAEVVQIDFQLPGDQISVFTRGQDQEGKGRHCPGAGAPRCVGCPHGPGVEGRALVVPGPAPLRHRTPCRVWARL